MSDNGLEYNYMFGGGAVRGAAYAGAIRALEELGIKSKSITGSSVGAIVATLLALGYNAKEINDIFLNVNFELFKDIQIGINSKFALSKGGVFLDWIRNLIESKYYGDKYDRGNNKPVCFKDIDTNLLIIATDILHFKPIEFSKFETPDYEIALAIRISCSMPGLMKPTEINGMNLVDGDLLKSLPMWKLTKSLKNSQTRFLEFRLEGESYEGKQNPIQFMNTVYTCMTNASAAFIKELYGQNDMFDCIAINTGDIVLIDFNCSKEKRQTLVDYGYTQTMNYFAKFLPNKKRKLVQKYTIIENSIQNAIKLIKSKKILKAKNVLSEIFIDLCDCQNELDQNIVTELKDFYCLFCDNIKYPALFGLITLKEPVKILNTITELQKNISTKISEINTYTNKF